MTSSSSKAIPKAPPDTGPPYPTYESLRDAQKWVRSAPNSGQLLFWPLNGPLTSDLAVLSTPFTPDTREPYYNETNGTWHPVSKLPITEPKVSSITVHVYELEQWEENWLDMHEGCSGAGGEGVEWGISEHEVDDETEEVELVLLKCCGVARPVDKDYTIVVKPTVDGDEGFVTVHDYLTAVHP
ncbi:uncharacterized protein LY89DRAFT_685945 [Mollisia scopiformis]|uniref:Uncharacterized protein n=1 Tax=Mollisia scopiformis TaxID=149040 RepID=A0A194X4N6_MOLSC|nr:uncharacterized protein LY89DRAFT_685945 [Mollisia scopiformis]KUJ15131.1 hypothetical protein LY89DRAFT_685945 [Mollisia scopiformis]